MNITNLKLTDRAVIVTVTRTVTRLGPPAADERVPVTVARDNVLILFSFLLITLAVLENV